MTAEVFWTVFPLWIKAFIFTLVIEVPVFTLIGRKGRLPERLTPIWRLALAGALGTILTHPCLWFVWPLVVHDYTWFIVTGEILVAIIEILVFFGVAYPIRFRYAVAASLIANGVSYGLGTLLY